MHGDEVRLAEQRPQLALLAGRWKLAGLDERIAVEHAHPEGGRPRRHRPRDVAEADQAERAPDQTEHRLARRHLPPSRPHEPLVECHLTRAREQQRHRVLGDLFDAVGRVVRHDDAGRRGRVEVDRVHADAVARDDPTLRHTLHRIGGDGAGVGIEERVAVLGLGQELGRRLRLERHQGGQPVERLVLDVERLPHVIGQHDLRHRHVLRGPTSSHG